MARMQIVYVTSSTFKMEECAVLLQEGRLEDGTAIGELFEVEFRQVPIKELLEVDIGVMVQAEAVSAYSQIKVPCIVEHAGLIFDAHREASYPGGLTKPMWNALGDSFIEETGSAGKRVTARAVVAYCDGMGTVTFTGERAGRVATRPRGERSFYWDTIFEPDDPSGKAADMTYAEIVASNALGLKYKVLELSQSAAALKQFFEYRRNVGASRLWSN